MERNYYLALHNVMRPQDSGSANHNRGDVTYDGTSREKKHVGKTPHAPPKRYNGNRQKEPKTNLVVPFQLVEFPPHLLVALLPDAALAVEPGGAGEMDVLFRAAGSAQYARA